MGAKIADNFTGAGKANGWRDREPPPDDYPPESSDTPEREQEAEPDYRFTPGGSFILDTDPEPKALWGDGDQVLWADGEALMIPGPQGVGKSTIAQQAALGRCAFSNYAELLGFRIIPGEKRVLYLAMDRPKQIARSFRRMVGDTWRAELDARLVVWQGPPPGDLAKYPSLLLHLCDKAHADTVIVDSLKDAAIGLSDDDIGAGYNRARQTALTGGVQVIELHHMRKPLTGAKADHPTIEDVYGSTWLTSGAGSVILINGAPGDPIVKMHHLKQPAAEVGPFTILHDDKTGRSTIWRSVDLLELVRVHETISAVDAARALYETEKPTHSEKEKARRALDRLVGSNRLWVIDQGDQKTNRPKLWATR
jgi:AAA domain